MRNLQEKESKSQAQGFFLFIILLFFFSLNVNLRAETIEPQIDFEVVRFSEKNSVLAVLWITPPKGYYTYAHDDTTAMPIKIHVKTGNGTKLSPIYADGKSHRDSLNPSQDVLMHDERFPIWIPLPKETAEFGASEDFELLEQMKQARSLQIELSMLLCSKEHCVPIKKSLIFAIPEKIPLLAEKEQEKYLQASKNFSSLRQETIPQKALEETPEKVLTEKNFIPHYFQAGLEPSGLGFAMLSGLIAGLLLNIMPCVLPVLTLKASTLMRVYGKNEDQAAVLRREALFFSAGILTWFAILAVAASFGMAWGGLFQHTLFVYGLAIFIFLLALSSFGLFTLPMLSLNMTSSKHSRWNAYATGITATLLATPCSGPLLGGVLGWVAGKSLLVILLVFLSTGIGMALPYMAMLVSPERMILFLPRPGAWLEVVEKLTGFFLLGTTIYLLSILPETLLFSALITLFCTALAAWLWGRWGNLTAGKKQRICAAVVALLLIIGSVYWSLQPKAQALWMPFHAEQFSALLEKEPILMQFTADWCPSCKVLEKTVLTPDRLKNLVAQYSFKLIRVDLTRPEPAAEALLRSLGSESIPLTALFPSGERAKNPVVLRDLYTGDQLEEAVKMATK